MARRHYGHWDDLSSNTRLELLQMMRELEVPFFPTAKNEELIAIIESRLDPKDPQKKAKAKQIYTTLNFKSRSKKPFYFVRLLTIFTIIFFTILLYKKFKSPLPYCNEDNEYTPCRKCPENADCGSTKAKCGNNQFLSVVGCRPKSVRKTYYAAFKISDYIKQRDGDCISNYTHLSLDDYSKMFPELNYTFFTKEPGFGIVVSDDQIFSQEPIIPYICKFIAMIDRNPNIVGPIIILIIIFTIYSLHQRQRQKKIRIAKSLAKAAHKILATTDIPIFMYDMKVQLRAKYPNIDAIWKHVMKFIEEDSHVMIGNSGSRHEVYWKWVH